MLKFRTLRGDMIEVYKTLTRMYEAVTKGRPNSFKTINRRCHYDLRKYSFCNLSFSEFIKHTCGWIAE